MLASEVSESGLALRQMGRLTCIANDQSPSEPGSRYSVAPPPTPFGSLILLVEICLPGNLPICRSASLAFSFANRDPFVLRSKKRTILKVYNNCEVRSSVPCS